MSLFVPKASLVAILVCFLLLSTASAHNITKILERDPQFSNFNQLLSETGIAKEINARKTVTVLAIPNDAMGGINGKSLDEIKNILKTHVILDYYDTLKLANMKGKNTIMTNLYQSTGVAEYSQGFLNATKTKDGVYFGSAVKNAPHNAKLTGSVAALPYNLSVLSISQPIDTPGMEIGGLAPVSAPPPKAVAAPPPAEEEAPAESPEEETIESPPPGEAPSPAEAPAPADDVQSPAPSPSDADADADDTASPKSSAGKLFVSSLGLAATLAPWLASF